MRKFFPWLCLQVERQDAVGVFARYAMKDKLFPRRSQRLYMFLIRYEQMSEQREGVKRAHREWRQSKRGNR